MTTSAMKIKFDFVSMRFQNLEMEQIEIWERLYPDVSIKDELVEMIRWIDRRKDTKIVRKKDWKRFICNWLASAQRKAVLA